MKTTSLTLVFLGLFLVGYCQTYQIADSLKALADTAAAQENWLQAPQLYDQAVQAEKAVSEPRQDSLCKALYGYSNSYYKLDSLDKALEIGLEAYDLANKVFPYPSTNLSDICDMMGNIHKKRLEYQSSLDFFLEALKNVQGTLGENHSSYGYALSSVGRVYTLIEEYDQALPYLIEALENNEKTIGKNHPNYANRLNNLGDLYTSMTQYEKALPCYLEALEIYKSSLGNNDMSVSKTLSDLGLLYEDIGQYHNALGAYIQALAITESKVGKNHTEYGIQLINLGGFYVVMGEYGEVLPLYNEALEIFETNVGKDHFYYAVTLNNLAGFYEETGQYEKALFHYEESLTKIGEIFGKDHPYYGRGLQNLGHAYWLTGQLEQALELSEEALEVSINKLGSDHADYGLQLENLGNLYRSCGQYDMAFPVLEEALQNTELNLGKSHPTYAKRLGSLGKVYQETGQYQNAIPLHSEALEILGNSLGKKHYRYGRQLMQCGLLSELTDNPQSAFSNYCEHLEIIYNQIDQSLSFMAEKEKEQFYKTVDGYFDHYLSFFTDYSRESPSSSTQSYNIELALKGLILASGIQVRESILGSGDSAVITNYENWELQRTLISKQYSLPIADRRSDLADLEERTQKLEAQLTRISADFGNAVATGSVEWSAIQNALGADEAAIEFSTFDYYEKGRHTDSVYYYAHILLPENEYPVSVFLCEESELNTLLAKTNERNRNYVQRIYGLAERGASLANPDDQVNLAELIWEPMAEYLEDKSRVYYAPSGLLHRLNLNAIEIDAFTTVADKVELVQMGSTGDLLDRKTNKELSMEEVALFGGLEYTTIQAQKEKSPATKSTAQATETAELNTYASRSSWGDLPYTLREVETISSILEDNQISHSLYTGDLGSEESFLKLTKENKSLDVLHFATHGYFFERDTTSLNLFMRSPNPLFRSGLIMSNANQAWVEGHFEEGQEDGVLTAYEIAQLDLRETELVVLSACETGLGDISNSEGVYGLQRAFKLAGVDYIIMTLWRVPDKQSKIMMEKFYTNWIEKDQPIPLAFRNAQAEMRELFDTYEWGGFVLVE